MDLGKKDNGRWRPFAIAFCAYHVYHCVRRPLGDQIPPCYRGIYSDKAHREHVASIYHCLLAPLSIVSERPWASKTVPKPSQNRPETVPRLCSLFFCCLLFAVCCLFFVLWLFALGFWRDACTRQPMRARPRERTPRARTRPPAHARAWRVCLHPSKNQHKAQPQREDPMLTELLASASSSPPRRHPRM